MKRADLYSEGFQPHGPESGYLFALGVETRVDEVSLYDLNRGESDRRMVVVSLGFWSIAWSWPVKHKDRESAWCECGHRLRRWQKLAYDSDLGKTIHSSCGDPVVVS